MKLISVSLPAVAVALALSCLSVQAQGAPQVQTVDAQRDECLLTGMSAQANCPSSFHTVTEKIARMDAAIATGAAAYSRKELTYLRQEREDLSRLEAYNNNNLPSYVP